MKKSPFVILCVLCCQWLLAQNTYVFKEGLAAGPCHQYGREALYSDLLVHQLIQGKLAIPREGSTLATDKQGKPILWKRVNADTAQRLRDASLSNGYLYLTYDSKEEKKALLQISGHSGVFVNGVPYSGDMYRYGWLFHPIALKKGLNEFYVRVGGGGRFQGITAKLIFPEKPVSISTADATLPHIVLEKTDGFLVGGIVVINTSDKPLNNLILRSNLAGKIMQITVPVISPLSTRKVKFVFNPAAVNENGEVQCNLSLLQNDKVMDEKSIRLTALSEKEHHSITFTSKIDGSVQYYAVAPRSGEEKRGGALFLSVHGAEVEAIGQARAYKPKDWGTLVAPTNRRPRGFNWEDWGRLDALEVLDIAQKYFEPDPQKIYLTGHSMGGHGSWYLGATYPGKWAGVAPCAGYPTLMGYGSADGKIPESSTNPAEQMLLRASSPSNVKELAGNYKASGIYVLHGDADRTVSVEYAREMRKLLSAFHSDFSYYEYPGGSHWYGDHSVDWPALFDFFKWHSIPKTEAPDTLNFTTANPAISSTYHWIGIEQQEAPLRYSNVAVQRNALAKSIRIHTNNVRILKLLPGAFASEQDFKLSIDGQEVCTNCSLKDQALFFVKNDKWEATSAPSSQQRNAQRNGTFKEGFNHRMVFVYGTTGTKEENEWAYQKAIFDAETWYYRGNGAVELIAYKDFNPPAYPDRGVILFGNATTNSAWTKLLANCPVQVSRGQVKLGDETHTGQDLGVYFTYPRPDSPIASVSVVAGTGVPGMKAAWANQYFAAGSGFPDYLIFTADLPRDGAKAIKATGFFDHNWQYVKTSVARGE